MSSEKKGFTLLEIMVIVVIIGFLAAIAIPHQIAKQNYKKVEYNVDYLQIKVNDYYRDKGMYPYSILDLIHNKYLNEKGFENPYNDTWQQVINGQAVSLGQIGYEFIDTPDMRYRITGCVPTGLLIKIGK